MKFIQGQSRDQINLFPVSLDRSIDPDNEVRIIDLFVESLSIKDYGFRTDFTENGRPAYHPTDLLKLFIYGYLNKLRSSRDLEKECGRNIEVMWLLKCLKPDHNTISNFRRDNPKAIKKVFRTTVQIARHFDLIGGKLIAGDSTKLRAHNSKKNNYNQAKIDRHVSYIDNKLEEYTKALAENDGDNRHQIEDEINKQQERKDNYKNIEKQLKESGENQISISDPDSRQLMLRNNITEVAYNVQTTVDAKHNIPIDYKVTNQNDSKAMGNMVQRAKSILGTNEFTVLYDKGFHTGSELKTAQELGVETIVAIPGVPSTSQAPNHDYNYEHFIYDKEADIHTCPQGQILTTNGSWYKEKTSSGNIILFRQYKTRACKSCQARSQCTRSRNGRVINRNEYAEYYERNHINILEKEHLYKRRQAIVEHPYGTLKRQWGFSYILTKTGIGRASSDTGFMFIAYNLRRIGNILTRDRLKEYLRILVSYFSSKIDLSVLKNSHSGIPFYQRSLWSRKFHELLIQASINEKSLSCKVIRQTPVSGKQLKNEKTRIQ
ncbi:MAG: IS1182 family transposase [Bacteroidales bacterium]|nr:IS1182 family transposase [Bacteroidales bacterium]